MNDEQINVIETYKESFVEDYEDWKEVVSVLNTNLYEYLAMFENYDIDVDLLEPFTYNEFCIDFIIQIERYYEEFDTLTKDAINAVFEVMILLKISNTSESPTEIIEKFLV